MVDFTGIKCPVCGQEFKEDDDVVVCPECGAPYHRECYLKEGHCVFTDLHEAKKEWAPPAPPKAPESSAEIKDRECPRCGYLNAHSALFCGRCGTGLLGEPQQHRNFDQSRQNMGGTRPDQSRWGQGAPGQGAPGQSGQERGTQDAPPPFNPYGAPQRGGYGYGPVGFVFDPMGGVNPADILDEGVSYGDASKLVKQNTTYYMPVFRYMKQSGRGKFNFSAFLFSGAWMLYRKQYVSGAIVTGLMFLLYILYLCSSIFIATPALMTLMEGAGMDMTRGFYPTIEEMVVISQMLSKDPGLYLEICIPMLCLLLMLVVMIFCGVRGNKMYMKHCVKMVRTVKAANVGDSPNMTLDSRGGVNTSIAVCMFVCYFLLVNVVPMLI